MAEEQLLEQLPSLTSQQTTTSSCQAAITMVKLKTLCTAGVAALCAVPSLSIPAHAEYEYEVDRFTGIQTASYWLEGSGCRQTKGIKGTAKTCLFINSTESAHYPRINVMKVNDGWELMSQGRKKQAPAIVTMTNGTVKRMKLNADLDTSTLYGGSVAEWVGISLGSLASQVDQIKTIELQYGSAEFKITPNRQAKCALKRAKSC